MLKALRTTLVIGLVMVAAGCTRGGLWPARPLPTPTYMCMRTATPIKVDGVLDDAAWAKARPMDLVLREGTGAPVQPTVAKALWDDSALYVAFTCQDKEIWATLTERDDALWSEEVVEVFLDPNSNGDPYFELEVNPLNVVVDLRFVRSCKGLRVSRTLKWNAQELQTAVKVKGKVNTWQTDETPGGQWVVEMAIPFAALDSLPNSPPKDGDAWRANFYRIERPSALGKEDDEYSCWSPIIISGSYHTLERFGRLVFTTQEVGAGG